MRSQQREEYLIRKAEEMGFVSISDAANRLDVSIETVRRDINKLSREGHLRKVRGGAEPARRFLRQDAPYFMRVQRNVEEKTSIGQVAARMIRNGSVVALDAGSSIQSLVESITDVQNVTFVTHSLPLATLIAEKLSRKEITGRLIIIGGEYDVQARYVRGALATESLSDYHFDMAFLSCTALTAEGVSFYNVDACSFASTMRSHATQSILLAESDKLGKSSVRKYADVTDFDCIVLDDRHPLPADLARKLEGSQTEVILVPCPKDE